MHVLRVTNVLRDTNASHVCGLVSVRMPEISEPVCGWKMHVANKLYLANKIAANSSMFDCRLCIWTVLVPSSLHTAGDHSSVASTSWREFFQLERALHTRGPRHPTSMLTWVAQTMTTITCQTLHAGIHEITPICIGTSICTAVTRACYVTLDLYLYSRWYRPMLPWLCFMVPLALCVDMDCFFCVQAAAILCIVKF